MCDWAMLLSLVIIDDLDIVGVALTELKADAPSRVHGHGPLLFTRTLELVEAHALERAEISQCARYVEREEQVNGGIEIKAAKLTGLFALPHLSVAAFRHDRIMAKTYYEYR